jgi:predicted kinase
VQSPLPAPPTLAISLPEPCLVVLVGAAGSGKTSLAARLFAADEVLSSDAYRAAISGVEADQGVTHVAFRLLHRDLDRRLAAGRTTVVDATNVTAFARRSLTRIASRHGVAAVAIVLDLPGPLVLARNATRQGRIVPEAAVRRHLADLERSLRRDQLAVEGFAAIHVLRDAAALDAFEIGARRP